MTDNDKWSDNEVIRELTYMAQYVLPTYLVDGKEMVPLEYAEFLRKSAKNLIENIKNGSINV